MPRDAAPRTPDGTVTAGATERWFVSRGVPHFILAYNAREDVLTRAAPLLVVVFLFSAISAIDLDWPAWGIVLAVIAGLGVLVSAWMAINRVRDQPLLARPARIGGVEVGVFLFVPTALPLLFGGDLAGSGITFLTMAGILLVAYAVTSYGLVALVTWGVGQMFRALGETLRLFARSLPLLLLGFMFLFINAEAWQSAGQIDRSLLLAVAGLFGVLAAVFLITQIPREMRDLNRFETWAMVAEYADDAPVAKPSRGRTDPPAAPPLTRREQGNLFLVFFVSQSLRLALVSAMVGLVFVALGLLIIRPETITLWTTEPPDVVWEFTLGGIVMTLTEELLQVSGFLAVFAAVYFSVYTITDTTLRSDFFEDTVAEARQNLAVRTLYRAAHGPAG